MKFWSLLGALTISAAAPIFAQQLKFEKKAEFWWPVTCNYMQVGDFDGDTKNDLALAMENQNFVTLLLQKNLYAPQNVIVGNVGVSKRGIVTADFNTDGFADMAVTDIQSAGRVAVFFGNSQSEFINPQYFPAGDKSIDIACSDYDKDGDQDLFVANQGDATVSLLKNNNGTFDAPVALNAGTGPETILLSDLNKDTFADLVVVNNGAATVSVLFNQGGASFAPAVTYVVPANPIELQLADINSDTWIDILVSHGNGTVLSILRGSSTAVFSPAITKTLPYPSSSGKFAVKDLNGDATPDIAINSTNLRKVMLLFNDGLGNFISAETTGEGSGTHAIHDVIADRLRSESTLPSLLINNQGTISVTERYNDGTGAFPSYNELHYAPFPNKLAKGDFNGDGKTDIAMANFYFGQFITIQYNDGSGFFNRNLVRNIVADGISNPYEIAAADLDSDGYADIIASDASSVTIRYGDAMGKFSEKITIPSGGGEVRIVDMNNDGKLDINTLSEVFLATTTRSYTSGSLQFTMGFAMTSTEVADMNDDGIPDKVHVAPEKFHFFAGKGDGTFHPALVLTTGASPAGLSRADFNNDGIDDVAFTDLVTKKVSIVLGSASQALSILNSFEASASPKSTVAVDLDEDQKADLLVVDVEGVFFLKGKGDGTFVTPAVSFITLTNPQDVILADLDGNGGDDVVVSSNSVNGGLNALTVRFASMKPTTPSSNLTFSDKTASSLTLHWQKGSGTHRLVIAKYQLPPTLPSADVAYTAKAQFPTGSQIGVGSFVVYSGTEESCTVTGLQPGALYQFAVVEFSGVPSAEIYAYNTTDYLTGSTRTLLPEPTIGASAFLFSPSDEETWTNGDGHARLILVKSGSAVDAVPVDDVLYTADATFGNGDELGDGNYAVFSGFENHANIEGLEPGVTYHVRIFEYNKSEDGVLANYLTDESLANDFNFFITGIGEDEAIFKVYPNPVENNVTIQVNNPSLCNITLLNSAGDAVINEQGLQFANTEVSMAGLPSGLYVLRVTVNGKSHSQKIIRK